MPGHTHLKLFVFAALALGLSAGSSAQQHRMAMADPSSFTVTAENGVPEIPFRVINNHLILPLSVNGSKPLDIALDTGMPAAGLALYGGPGIETLDLDIDPSIQAQVGGAGGQGGRLSAEIAMSESLSLPGLEIEGARVIVMPAMPDFAGYHDGIVGYSLFGNYVVELDYDERLMRLHDPVSYEAPARAHVVPLTLKNRLPYVTARVTLYDRQPFETKVVVDLGASHAISLNTDFSERISVREKFLSAIIGRGLSGPVRGRVGRIAELELGGARLSDVVATFPVSEHQNPRGVDSLGGNLGSDVLRRFNTTFDYAGERMILVPNQSTGEAFRFDRSGMRLGLGEQMKVEGVIAGSPAEESGVEVGDFLTHVNGQAVSASDYGTIRKTLMGAGAVRLTLRRAGRTIEKTVTLRRLI